MFFTPGKTPGRPYRALQYLKGFTGKMGRESLPGRAVIGQEITALN